MRLGIIATVHSPPPIIRDFVNYHLSTGIDNIILYIDDPDPAWHIEISDSGVDIINRSFESYPEHIKEKDEEYPSLTSRKHWNAMKGFELAKERHIDFLFHIDIDELIYSPSGNVHDLFKNAPVGIDVLTLLTAEAIPFQLDHISPFREINRFKDQNILTKGSVDRERFLISIFGLSKILFRREYFRGHKCGKTAIRVAAPVTAIGNHRPVAQKNYTFSEFTSKEGRILHYDSCSYQEWKQKWERRLSSKAVSLLLRKNRRMQTSLFMEYRDSEEKLLDFYESLYFVSKRNFKLLRILGIARRIDGPRLFFSRSASKS